MLSRRAFGGCSRKYQRNNVTKLEKSWIIYIFFFFRFLLFCLVLLGIFSSVFLGLVLRLRRRWRWRGRIEIVFEMMDEASLLQRFRHDRRKLLEFLFSSGLVKELRTSSGTTTNYFHSLSRSDFDTLSVDYVLHCLNSGMWFSASAFSLEKKMLLFSLFACWEKSMRNEKKS